MASQILQSIPSFESFHNLRPMSFSESHLPERLLTGMHRPSAETPASPSSSSSLSISENNPIEVNSLTVQRSILTTSPDFEAHNCQLLTASNLRDQPVTECEHQGNLMRLVTEPPEVPVPSSYQTNAKFEGHILEDDEPETENQFTVTSLSGKPLLAPAAARLASRSRRQKPNKKKKNPDTKAEIEALRRRFVPPDGGYGWYIAFAAFLVQFWIAGLIKSYGVIYMEVLQIFPGSSASLASWIPAILSTICLVFSPICSALCQRFSCRSVVFIGGILCWLGISLSFFASNLIQLCFTFGVLTGFGAGLSTTPGIIMTSRYFDKRRALANGICVSGTAAGSMVIPPLMEYLVPKYGFRGSILILGACMLHVCISAAIYRPMEVHQRIIEISRMKQKRKVDRNSDTGRWNDVDISANRDSIDESTVENANPSVNISNNTLQVPERNVGVLSGIPEDGDSIGDGISLNDQRTPRTRRLRGSSMLHSIEDLSTDSTCVYKDAKSVHGNSVTSLRQSVINGNGTLRSERSVRPASESSTRPASCCSKLNHYIDLSLTKDPIFQLMASTVMLMAVGCPHMLFYMPAYANSLGLSKSDCSLLLSISAILDLVGRLGFGWIADLHLFSNIRAYSVSILVGGIAVLCLPFATTFTSFAIIVSFYGLGLGCWFLLIPVLLREHHGTEAIASSYGLVRLFQGLVTLTVPPLIGLIKDRSGDYIIGFYFMGVSMVIGSIVINIIPCIRSDDEDSQSGQ